MQLLGRAKVERAARKFMRFRFELSHLLAELAALLGQHLAIDEYAGFFHVQQHRHEGLLDLFVDLFSAGTSFSCDHRVSCSCSVMSASSAA